jgi:hypothetical protein
LTGVAVFLTSASSTGTGLFVSTPMNSDVIGPRPK